MKTQSFALWFRIVSVILAMFGLLYVFVGLKVFAGLTVFGHVSVLPAQGNVLIEWESALYGAIMIGWAVTLALVGRIAFQRDDRALKQALLLGLFLWLVIEAAASMWLGVWFNTGVDVVVFALFAIPLLRG